MAEARRGAHSDGPMRSVDAPSHAATLLVSRFQIGGGWWERRGGQGGNVGGCGCGRWLVFVLVPLAAAEEVAEEATLLLRSLLLEARGRGLEVAGAG